MFMDHQGIILIHGAGLGSFIWDEVRNRLRFPALAVEFPNRNRNYGENRKLRFSDYTKTIINQIERWKVDEYIIVTHSLGGCLGLQIAQHYKERVIGFVAIGSAIPANGDSYISCLPRPQRMLLPLLFDFAGTKPPPWAIKHALCNDLSGEQKSMIARKFTPESKSIFLERCNALIPDTRRMYIRLASDKEFPVSIQDKMAANLKADKIITLQSGHLPMLSKPAELVKTLIGFYNEVILEMNYTKN
jgi:pimeloyl-ACP methyl ester carboxylesterase